MSRPKTPKGRWHRKTLVFHALRNWWKSTTPYAEQLLLPGMEEPPQQARTAAATKAFILAVIAEARPDGQVVFSQDYAAAVYSIGRQQYQRSAQFYKRHGVLTVTSRPAPGRPAVYLLRMPEWLTHFAPPQTQVLEAPTSTQSTGVPEAPTSDSTGVLEEQNGGASSTPTKRSKNQAQRASAGAAPDNRGTANPDAPGGRTGTASENTKPPSAADQAIASLLNPYPEQECCEHGIPTGHATAWCRDCREAS